MAIDDELFAERGRRTAVALAAQEAGSAATTHELDEVVRTKLRAAWDDLVENLGPEEQRRRVDFICKRTRRSLGKAIAPSDMDQGFATDNGLLLSLVEAEHEVLISKEEVIREDDITYHDTDFGPLGLIDSADGLLDVAFVVGAPDEFRRRVNEIFEAHAVAYRLSPRSRLVPVESYELHESVVAPTLQLLHDHERFAGTEVAYENALTEIRNGDAGDAITDAATALQSALETLGCDGNTLGTLLKSARNKGLMREGDTPLVKAVEYIGNWVATQRNHGEAHKAIPDSDLGDAWMVGALIVRLVDADSKKKLRQSSPADRTGTRNRPAGSLIWQGDLMEGASA